MSVTVHLGNDVSASGDWASPVTFSFDWKEWGINKITQGVENTTTPLDSL